MKADSKGGRTERKVESEMRELRERHKNTRTQGKRTQIVTKFSSRITSFLCFTIVSFIGENNGGGNRLDVRNFVRTVVSRPGSRGVAS